MNFGGQQQPLPPVGASQQGNAFPMNPMMGMPPMEPAREGKRFSFLSPESKKIAAALLSEFLGTLFLVLVAVGIQVWLLCPTSLACLLLV